MPVEFGHEGLTEAHDLPVGLALGVKVGAALGTAHGQPGEAVLEYLFKAEEFHNGQVHAGMQTQTALVRADGGIELHPVAAVDLDVPVVIRPCDPEDHHPLRLNDAVDDLAADDVGTALHHRFQRGEHLLHRLKILLLLRVALNQPGVDSLEIFVFDCHGGSLLRVMLDQCQNFTVSIVYFRRDCKGKCRMQK